MIDVALTELEPLISSSAACRLLGKSRATLHRQRHPRPTPETPAWAARPAPPWALADTERAALLAVLNDDRFADKSHFTVFDCFAGTLLEYFKSATAATSRSSSRFQNSSSPSSSI